MLEKRNDVRCSLVVTEAVKPGMAAERPTLIRSAFGHGIGRVERRQFERLPKGAHPTGFGPSVTERARRKLPGMTAGIVARRSRCLRARAATDGNITLPPVDRPRRSGRRRGRRGPDADA